MIKAIRRTDPLDNSAKEPVFLRFETAAIMLLC
jgi:hypothetical protein